MSAQRPQIRRDASALPAGTAACIGAFDGMHRGHQALIERARSLGDAVALVTFDPHPSQVLQPARAPRLLQTPEQRARVAGALGVETLVLLPFDRSMAALPPEEFVRRYLLEGLRPRAVVVGEDFRFGADRGGDAELLRRMLRPAGVVVEALPAVATPGALPGTKLSSSDIRRAVDAGDVEQAGRMLGRWHAVLGEVVEGARRGRTIGFPTANVATDGYLPRAGVYATALAVWDRRSAYSGRVWPSVTNVGTNPTFVEAGALTCEVHVLDEDLGDRLYGAEVEVSFIARLRDELKFDSPEALVARIRQDVEAAREHLTEDNLRHLLPPPT